MTTRDDHRSGPRPVRAPRGAALTCKAWPQEAAMRMLMNNLDPEVAEHPDQLIVYGGSGRAARSWDAYAAIVNTLKELEDDETMLVQSGKPVGVLRTHEWAPRVLIANSNLVPQWATWEEFRRLESLGLTMFGQMTAGSWIYIGTQGILQGTYETFAAVAAKRFGGSLAGTITLTAGLGGMGGAQPLAVTMNGGGANFVGFGPSPIAPPVEDGYLDGAAHHVDDAPRPGQAPAGGGSPTAAGSAAGPGGPGTPARSRSGGSAPPTSGRCSARARGRSGGRRCRGRRPTSPPPTRRSSTCSPGTSLWPGGSGWPGRRCTSKGYRPGSA